MSSDPIERFRRALSRAAETETFDATRAALATADANGRPSVRFVLVKRTSNQGFVFYTNYTSRKAKELVANPHASLAFHWSSTGEQVRVEGAVHRAPPDMSDAYFGSRTPGSQLGAIASPQSEAIASREELLARVEAARAHHSDKPIHRPDYWGGYIIVPAAIEFWTNGLDRLHDRLLYTRSGAGWSMTRLAP